jgi:hypothetical protein
MKKFELPIYGIVVEIDGKGGGSISSTDLKTALNDPEDELYNAAMDGIESLILAHACADVDITTPYYLEGIENAVDACANNIY